MQSLKVPQLSLSSSASVKMNGSVQTVESHSRTQAVWRGVKPSVNDNYDVSLDARDASLSQYSLLINKHILENADLFFAILNWLSFNDIENLKQICKIYLQAIRGSKYSLNSKARYRLENIQQLYNVSPADKKFKFTLTLESIEHINAFRNVIEDSIGKKVALENIECIFFSGLNYGDLIGLHEVLNLIFKKQNLFSSFKVLRFQSLVSRIYFHLNIPLFNNLEELGFRDMGPAIDLNLDPFAELKKIDAGLLDIANENAKIKFQKLMDLRKVKGFRFNELTEIKINDNEDVLNFFEYLKCAKQENKECIKSIDMTDVHLDKVNDILIKDFLGFVSRETFFKDLIIHLNVTFQHNVDIFKDHPAIKVKIAEKVDN